MEGEKSSKSKQKKVKPPKTVTVPKPDEDEDDEPLEVKFEREVAWCKDHIFHKLHHVKLDSKQGFELARCLKILDSDKAVMIKKRQAMRTTLGDYRKKMKADEKKKAAAAKITLKPAEEDKAKLSKCFKQSTAAKKQKAGEDNSVEERVSELSLADDGCQGDASALDADNIDNQKDFKFKKSQNEFRFNFNASETKTGDSASGDMKPKQHV